MNIAFDMDGVLRELSLSELKLGQILENFDAFKIHQLRDTEPLLNPFLFALPDDRIFCITNTASEEGVELKKRWLNHFYGDRIILIPTMAAKGKWGKEYVDEVAREKLYKCYKHDIDVYFDDDPAIIRKMRELHFDDCLDVPIVPHTKFLKYGAWIEEIY